MHTELFLYVEGYNTNWTSTTEPKTREMLKDSNLSA